MLHGVLNTTCTIERSVHHQVTKGNTSRDRHQVHETLQRQTATLAHSTSNTL